MSTTPDTSKQSGLLFGVLLTNGLLIKRGGTFVYVKCCHPAPITSSVTGIWTRSTANSCSHDCVMFGEPYVNEDGTVTLEICDGKRLKFKRLIDLRSEIESIDLETATDEEIARHLEERNIITY